MELNVTIIHCDGKIYEFYNHWEGDKNCLLDPMVKEGLVNETFLLSLYFPLCLFKP